MSELPKCPCGEMVQMVRRQTLDGERFRVTCHGCFQYVSPQFKTESDAAQFWTLAMNAWNSRNAPTLSIARINEVPPPTHIVAARTHDSPTNTTDLPSESQGQ